ncbi:hypothetical protein HMPREF1051_2007 [Neisseria sicca VK64]|uniref:Uncharacterized protein n=1 Tax=Neisseria sicca VK64 TaxID=1095748 RepID=I2NUI9_NEISI|nr:hypothetical protein HMPREF1051_2007 [Neisseria sicca VK64]
MLPDAHTGPPPLAVAQAAAAGCPYFFGLPFSGGLKRDLGQRKCPSPIHFKF